MRADGDVALLLGSGGETRWGFFVVWGVGLEVMVAGRTQSRHKSSPPHSQSLALRGETAVGGSASGVQSGQAAGRSPGTPEEEGEEDEAKQIHLKPRGAKSDPGQRY